MLRQKYQQINVVIEMKYLKNKKAAPVTHPLQQLREVLDWSREVCGKETGLKASSIQNIERGAAPLSVDDAFAIEAATSCNAMALAESSEVWRKMKDENPELFSMAGHSPEAVKKFRPKNLQGTEFSLEAYEHYKKAALPPENVAGAIEDLSRRIHLLLGPMASKPEKFRRMYRYLAQVLNSEKASHGPTDAEMAEFALGMGNAELKEMTIGELGSLKEIHESPQWQSARIPERFKAKEKVHVTVEEFPFWPNLERLGGQEDYFVPDFAFGQRQVWRITLPNGRPMVVAIDHTNAAGLQGKLTDAMISINKERRQEGGFQF